MSRGYRVGMEIEEKIFIGALGGLHSATTYVLERRHRGCPPDAPPLRSFGPRRKRQDRAVYYWEARDAHGGRHLFREMDLEGYSYFDESDGKSKHYLYECWSE